MPWRHIVCRGKAPPILTTGKNHCSHCTKVWVDGLRLYYQLEINSFNLWQLMYWLYWLVSWLPKDTVSFITQSISTRCVSVRPSPIQLPNEQRHRIIKYNVHPRLNKEYNCVNCNLPGNLVYAKFGVKNIPCEVIKPAMMVVRTLEMNDRSSMLIWYFGKYSAFLRGILYRNGKKACEIFWFDISLKSD
jgi:hypothetical protein